MLSAGSALIYDNRSIARKEVMPKNRLQYLHWELLYQALCNPKHSLSERLLFFTSVICCTVISFPGTKICRLQLHDAPLSEEIII